MSTVVDKKRGRRARTSAEEMRARILRTAGTAFCRASYDAVGIREIAAAARTDPAIVIRLFGSKAALFETIAEAAFGGEEVFSGPIETLGARLAAHLSSPMTPASMADEDMDDVQFLLRSATSVTAGPILSSALHKALIEPLGRRLRGPDGLVRAALVASQVLGFATLRFALGSAPIEESDRALTTERLADLLQRAVDG